MRVVCDPCRSRLATPRGPVRARRRWCRRRHSKMLPRGERSRVACRARTRLSRRAGRHERERATVKRQLAAGARRGCMYLSMCLCIQTKKTYQRGSPGAHGPPHTLVPPRRRQSRVEPTQQRSITNRTHTVWVSTCLRFRRVPVYVGRGARGCIAARPRPPPGPRRPASRHTRLADMLADARRRRSAAYARDPAAAIDRQPPLGAHASTLGHQSTRASRASPSHLTSSD